MDNTQYVNYRAIVLFGAFTGQRPISTIGRLAIRQFRALVKKQKPVLEIPSDCDKIRMAHYCPLAAPGVEAVVTLISGQGDDTPMFNQLSFERCLSESKIRLIHSNSPFQIGDLRKWAEQYVDIIQWDQSNRAYILTHGVRGVGWSNYRHPLPEHVYDVYMRYGET